MRAAVSVESNVQSCRGLCTKTPTAKFALQDGVYISNTAVAIANTISLLDIIEKEQMVGSFMKTIVASKI